MTPAVEPAGRKAFFRFHLIYSTLLLLYRIQYTSIQLLLNAQDANRDDAYNDIESIDSMRYHKEEIRVSTVIYSYVLTRATSLKSSR